VLLSTFVYNFKKPASFVFFFLLCVGVTLKSSQNSGQK